MLPWISKVIHIKHSHGGFDMLEDQLRLEFIRCVRYIFFDYSDTWSSITSCKRKFYCDCKIETNKLALEILTKPDMPIIFV